MRARASLTFAAVLAIALVAVAGFAAFSTQGTGPAPPTTAVVEPESVGGVPTTANGRVLGAVVAASLIPEPVIEEPPVTVAAPKASVAQDTAAEDTSAEDPPTTKAPKTTTAPAAPPHSSPPELAITWPKDDGTVDDRVIQFRGTTEPGATVTSGNYSADVDDEGNWKIKLSLREGRNRVHFTAEDTAGNQTTESLTVNYDPPETTTTTTTTKAPTTTTSTSPPTTTTGPPDGGGPRNVEEWRELVEQYFLPEIVEEALVVMKCESKGNPSAYNSRSGASGLFQFIPNTWNWASTKAGWAGASPFDPEANIASAAWLTEWSINRGNDAWSHWSCKP